jgi:hypothetical protein
LIENSSKKLRVYVLGKAISEVGEEEAKQTENGSKEEDESEEEISQLQRKWQDFIDSSLFSDCSDPTMMYRSHKDGIVILRELALNPEQETEEFSDSIDSLRFELAAKVEILESENDKKVCKKIVVS